MATRAKTKTKRKTKVKAKSKTKVKAKTASKVKRRAAPAPREEVKRNAEEQLLLEEEARLELDAENEDEETQMTDSPEYIAEALEDPLGKELGEASVESATSGDQADQNIHDEEVPEETGGPFVETDADEELADDEDESNPADAEPAAFPTTSQTR